MILFLDFDDTLLNTKRFNEALARRALLEYGVTDDMFSKTHAAVKATRPPEFSYYSLDEHIQLLVQHTSSDYRELKSSIFEFVKKNTKEFMFSDVPLFLKEFSEHTLVLITMTHDEKNEYQKQKIAHSGIAKYFKDIILTFGETKGVHIKKYISQHELSEPTVLLDDRAGWLMEAKEENPTLIPVQMRRKDGRYHDEDIGDCTHVRDMKEFADLLKTFYNVS